MNSNFEILKILVDNGARLNERDSDRNTAAHYAAQYNNSKHLKYLAFKKANFKLENYKSQTPLDVAACKDNVENVRIAL